MAELVTFAVLVFVALVLTGFSVYKNSSKPFSVLAGLVAGLVFVVAGVLVLSSGLQYFSGSSQSYTYSSTPANTSYYNASGSFNSSSIENVIIVGSIATTNSYSNAAVGLSEPLAVLFILLGLGVAFLTVLSLYDKEEKED